MAELKEFEEYDISIPQEVDTKVVAAPEEPVLTYPKKRLQNISRVEKSIVALFILAFVTMAVLTVKLTTTISRGEEEIAVIQGDIDRKTDQISKLEQEKNELSRADRIKKAAEEAGLEVKDENIRNVKK
ncbi:cell division protein FtsL [uncultured Vagococcus sp.]|uniref:cell division protein FtsL n=1 Tax=uncultured Vagococcus sp. TaxID=189676 RepID=UPI0028D1F72E|nr:cell division protein FtsL [uncultured Vagococcus sp.]